MFRPILAWLALRGRSAYVPPMSGMSARDVERGLKAAERVCVARGERLTDMRRRALGAILAAPQPMKAYDLLLELGEEGRPAKPPTAYRALDFLSRLGLIHRIETLNAYVPCLDAHDDHRCAGPELYICEACGQVEERHAHGRPGDPPKGFRLTRSVVEHYGRCAACARG